MYISINNIYYLDAFQSNVLDAQNKITMVRAYDDFPIDVTKYVYSAGRHVFRYESAAGFPFYR